MAVRSYPKSKKIPLSAHFDSSEFDCGCSHCKETWIEQCLVERLESLRDVLGCPILINSGYRCGHHQGELRERGYPTAKGKSTHEMGMAADITTGRHNSDQLEDAARKAGFKAVGIGDGWVHVDSRDDCERKWTYPKKG